MAVKTNDLLEGAGDAVLGGLALGAGNCVRHQRGQKRVILRQNAGARVEPSLVSTCVSRFRERSRMTLLVSFGGNAKRLSVVTATSEPTS